MPIEVSPRKPHVLVIPWPGQGHVNPSLAFAKCLASKGLRIILVITKNVATTAKFLECTSISIESISDGSEDVQGTVTIQGYFSRFRTVFSRNLARLLDETISGAPVIIYDSTMPWVQGIAKERGLLSASFFTQTCAVSSVFYHVRQGAVRYPYEDCTVRLPALPELERKDLPSFAFLVDPENVALRHLTDQFLNLEGADWIFFNTFYELESEIIEWMRRRWPAIKTVGPTFLLDHKLSGGNNNHTISFFKPNQDACTQWLDSKETGSVIYVSFGSIATLKKEQMEELAHGLVMSNCHFLWVVRSSEMDKLPQDFTPERGLIVAWCHQPQVLAHRAVACFMSHCGWNSTLEALSNGVPLVAMGQWADQTTNAKFVEDVWRVGVGVRGGENGIVGREEIAMRVKEVVGGRVGIELKKNAYRWKELCGEAVGKGGSSTNNIDDFVSKLVFEEQGNISPTSVFDLIG